MTEPLAIDLFCGLGGWTEALLAAGYDVVGFDIERHQYGAHRYPGQLVLQDVRTLHGAQFREAALIVSSPPCQAYSHMAMPWTRARAKAAAIRADTSGKMLAELNCLFDACFRIQREACAAAGRHVPLIVENVRGAQPWVGRARWAFGSYYLWGDVPALMPITFRIAKRPGHNWSRFKESGEVSPHWRLNGEDSAKSGKGRNPDGRKWHGPVWFDTGLASLPSSSPRRKAASALIAKIPQPLARHIAVTFYPKLC
jgi:C-5 cytosine-specific DNA methylase